MLLQIQGVFAEYERALIKDRMRRGRLFAARQGRLTWGNPPYGYRYRPKADNTPQQLLIDEAEAEIVRLIYGWLIEEGCSSYAIEKRLVTQGVLARARNRTGWRQSSVIGILRSPLYRGEGYYNRTMAVDAKRPHKSKGLKDYRLGNLRGRAERPREEWISVRVPAIVDPETWELAQAQLARNRERATRHNTRRDYLLRSLLVCGCCGRRLVGMWRNGSGQYVCSARYPRHQPWACHGRSVRDRKVEPLIWDYVQELLGDPELLQERYREGQGDPAIGQRDEHERDRLARKIAALDREVQRLIDAYQAEVIDLTELKQRRVRIEEHGQVLRARLAELVNQRAEREQEIRLLEGLQAFSASVRDGLHDPSFAVKQRVLQLVVDRIVVEDSRVVVHHVVPSGPVRLQTGQFSKCFNVFDN
jgi:site-specific DNA recombinase